MVNDINKYKKALIFTKDLAKLKASMENAISEIEKYKKYLPAQECIETLSRNLTTVKVHLDHHQKIVESKGAKNE